MSQLLMKVQIGPVQEFIAQARSTRDMWAGSYLLAWLTAAAMKVFKEADCEFIFPTLEGQPLYKMFTTGTGTPTGLIPTLPNAFMLLINEDQVDDLAEKAKAALKKELQKIGDACWKEMLQLGAEEAWKTRWDDQLNHFPIFNWQAVPTTGNWQNDVATLGTQFAARRNTRDFKPWNGITGATKDVLSGKEESIGSEAFWKKKAEFWKGAGPFGAMNCIKRLFPSEYLEKEKKFRSKIWDKDTGLGMYNTRDIAARNKEGESSAKDANHEKNPVNPYFALIAMDGDRMGAALKKIESKMEHRKFSKRLAEFSEKKINDVLKKFPLKQDGDQKPEKLKPQLIYAGGDDVLVMCPADIALDLAEALRNAFLDVMKEFKDLDPEKPMDASCGIAVGHYQFPLQRIVDEARKAETRAKNKRGRAAFALTLLKRSGEIIHWGAKWDSDALKAYKDFTEKSRTGDSQVALFSSRFPYALAELLAPYRLSDLRKSDPSDRPIPKETLTSIIQKEFEHVQERQALKKGAQVEHATDYLNALTPETLEDFPNLFLASAFMNRQRGEN